MTIINYKLLQLIKSFSVKEEKEFRKFISSPIFSSGRNYLPVFNEIKKLNKNGSLKISSHELYNKIYPGKKYNSQTLKNRFSELFKLGEEFLIYTSIKHNKFERDKILIQSFMDRKMIKFFESTYKKTIAEINNLKDDDVKFSNLFFLQKMNLNFLSEIDRIDEFYEDHHEHSIYSVCITLITLFEFGIEFKQQEYRNRKYEFNPVIGILQNLNFLTLIQNFKRKDLHIIDVVKMMHHLYKAYENPENESEYFEAREIFRRIKDSLSENYKFHIYMIFIYYCTRRQNQAIKKFHYELFKLYNEKLDSGFYSDFSEKIYPVNNFRDYVFIGIEVNQFEWVVQFIKKYSYLLPDYMRDNEIKLSYARLNIAKQEYDKAFEFLIKVKPANYLHYMDTSIMKMMCQYELEMIEESYFEIDKLKHYLRNHKEIPRIHKAHVTNFIRIYNSLLKYLSKPECYDSKILLKEINNIEIVSKKEWLIEKITDLTA